jgi:hypothetical protein
MARCKHQGGVIARLPEMLDAGPQDLRYGVLILTEKFEVGGSDSFHAVKELVILGAFLARALGPA